MNAQLRHAPIELKVRAASEDAAAPEGILEGYASVFDVEYRIGYHLKESIQPGAFKSSLAARDGVLPIFYQHDWDNPIGHASAVEDKKGLKVEATLYIEDNERARAVYKAAAAGALREWSIGYYLTRYETVVKEDDSEVDLVHEADVVEASVVVKGANPATEMIAVRKEADPEPEPELELDEYVAPAHLLDGIAGEHVRAIIRAQIAAAQDDSE